MKLLSVKMVVVVLASIPCTVSAFAAKPCKEAVRTGTEESKKACFNSIKKVHHTVSTENGERLECKRFSAGSIPLTEICEVAVPSLYSDAEAGRTFTLEKVLLANCFAFDDGQESGGIVTASVEPAEVPNVCASFSAFNHKSSLRGITCMIEGYPAKGTPDHCAD